MIRDVILMTIYLALFVLCISFVAHFFGLSQLHYLFIFSEVFFVSGICSCNVVYTYRGPLGRI